MCTHCHAAALGAGFRISAPEYVGAQSCKPAPSRQRERPALSQPKSLLEAAALDGANRWQIPWKVVFPIVRPTLSVLLIFFFIWIWNEFFIPLVMLIDNDTQTIPVALASLQGDRLMDAPTTNAGALISLIPAVIFFFIFQRTLTRGVTAGAIK